LSKHQKSLFERYRGEWDANALVDPMWAVLSLPEKMGGAWDEEDFYKIGEQEIAELFRFMNSHSIALDATEKVLDFGSGLGRLTEPLARHFRTAVGIDISQSMIEKATVHASAIKAVNIQYLLSTSFDLSNLGIHTFDFVYTNITLQHLNNDLQKSYIRQFAQLLRVRLPYRANRDLEPPSGRNPVPHAEIIGGPWRQTGY
jgi:2-polyprenyl-3-methyl-5-hydroxy-6-metoxy-1,4-benzoquinol methylase